MPISERFQRFQLTLSIGASIVAILSAVLAVVAYLRTDDLHKLYHATRQLELHLSIASPKHGATLQATPVPWTGTVTIRNAASPVPAGNVTLELAERDIQIVPVVRPVSGANLWWVQSSASVDAHGALAGALNLGERQDTRAGIAYQVVLIAVPSGTVRQGQTFTDLPRHSAESVVITVTRDK